VKLRRGITPSVLPLVFGTTALAQRVEVLVENPLDLARRDEVISVRWSAVREALPNATGTRVRVVDPVTSRDVAMQVVDVNADGQPDELLFQTSFWPNESKRFVVEARPPVTPAAPRVHVKYVDERGDVAWESDRIAFRTYGQKLWALENLHSSGVDVWVKRTRALILDKWYAKGQGGYHVDTGEGADFYRVGSTLGGGGTAIWRNDTLYRAENFARHRIIATGPIRAIVELEFDPWDAGGVRVTETKRISIDAGSQLFRQESIFRADGVTELPVAVGFVKREGIVGSTHRGNCWSWVSGWAPVERVTGGHGELGLAALVERQTLLDVRETSDHYLAIMRVRPGTPVVYYAGAGWSASGHFSGPPDWWSYLDGFGRRLASRIEVTLLRDGQVLYGRAIPRVVDCDGV
jgi:pectinesterase